MVNQQEAWLTMINQQEPCTPSQQMRAPVLPQPSPAAGVGEGKVLPAGSIGVVPLRLARRCWNHWFGWERRRPGYSPVVDGSSGVLAAPHFDHEQREEQEERRHGETDAVHGPVAHQHLTVDVAPHSRESRARPLLTEAWNLTTSTRLRCPPSGDGAYRGCLTFFSCSSMPGISMTQATPTPSSRKRA